MDCNPGRTDLWDVSRAAREGGGSRCGILSAVNIDCAITGVFDRIVHGDQRAFIALAFARIFVPGDFKIQRRGQSAGFSRGRNRLRLRMGRVIFAGVGHFAVLGGGRRLCDHALAPVVVAVVLRPVVQRAAAPALAHEALLGNAAAGDVRLPFAPVVGPRGRLHFSRAAAGADVHPETLRGAVSFTDDCPRAVVVAQGGLVIAVLILSGQKIIPDLVALPGAGGLDGLPQLPRLLGFGPRRAKCFRQRAKQHKERHNQRRKSFERHRLFLLCFVHRQSAAKYFSLFLHYTIQNKACQDANKQTLNPPCTFSPQKLGLLHKCKSPRVVWRG